MSILNSKFALKTDTSNPGKKRIPSLSQKMRNAKISLVPTLKTRYFGKKNFPKPSNLFGKSEIEEKLLHQTKYTKNGRASVRINYQHFLSMNNIDINDSENFQAIVDILKKGQFSKTDVDIYLLEKAFGENSFFKEISNELSVPSIKSIYKNLSCLSLKKYETVFRHGDIGDSFFIILKGTVSVLVPKKEELDDIKVDRRSSLRPQNLSKLNVPAKERDQALRKSFDSSSQKENEDEFYERHFPGFMKVKKLKPGDSFGEVALRDNVKRTATILAEDECYFALLNKEAFRTILSKIDVILEAYYQNILNQNIEFLKSSFVFSGLANQEIHKFFLLAKKRNFKYNEAIYIEGQVAESLYLIREGTAELKKCINEGNRELYMRVAVLGAGEFFGDNDTVVSPNPTRRETAFCTATQSLIYEFDISILKSYPASKKILGKMAQLKKEKMPLVEKRVQDFKKYLTNESFLLIMKTFS